MSHPSTNRPAPFTPAECDSWAAVNDFSDVLRHREIVFHAARLGSRKHSPPEVRRAAEQMYTCVRILDRELRMRVSLSHTPRRGATS